MNLSKNHRESTVKPIPKNGAGLWDNYYDVSYLFLHSRNVDYLKRYGMRVSGMNHIDRQLDKQEIQTQASIDTMFEKWRTGVTVRVLRYEDTAEIYRIIQSHIVSWMDHLENGINVGNAPLKDLVQLDEFAAVVYDKARNIFSTQSKETFLARNFAAVQPINYTNILKRSIRDTHNFIVTDSGAEVVKINEKEPSTPERESMKKFFAEHMRFLGGWGGERNGK